MTDDNRNDRRREFDGRIDTLGTGTNGLSRRNAGSMGASRGEREEAEEEDATEAPLTDEESPGGDEAEDSDTQGSDAETEGETDVEEDESVEADDSSRADGVTPEAAVSREEDEEAAGAEESDSLRETRSADVDDRASLEVELDPFVRAAAARRADERDESLDEYVVGSVKGYLAGLLGGDVSSPGTLDRGVEVEADPVFDGLLESIAGENETPAEVVVDAVAQTYDVPVEEETLVVAGLRDHEALLNGVVANSSNDLDDVSEVVQAAVETRLVEEPA